MAFDLPSEDEKPRKVVMIRSMDLDEAELGEQLLEPVRDLKLGLSRLYKLTKDDQWTALLRHLAAQVSQLEELQRSLTSTNGHLAPAVLPPSWQDKKDQVEIQPSRQDPAGANDEPGVGSEEVGDPNDSLQPEVLAMQPPDASKAVRDPEVSGRSSRRIEAKEPLDEVDPSDDAHQDEDTGDLLRGRVVLLDGSDEHAPSDAELGADSADPVEVDAGPAQDRADGSSLAGADKSEARKALWQKAKERGWTTNLKKTAPPDGEAVDRNNASKQHLGAKPSSDLASPTVPSEDRVNLEAPTIPHIKEADKESQGKSPPANDDTKAKDSPEPRTPLVDKSSSKNLDDEEALEAFSVSLLEFEPKTQIHRRSENKPQMSWPPPPPSQYNPEDYEELGG
jgi:hypothetical protein